MFRAYIFLETQIVVKSHLIFWFGETIMEPHKPEFAELVLFCSARTYGRCCVLTTNWYIRQAVKWKWLSLCGGDLHGIALWSSLKSETTLMDPTKSITWRIWWFLCFCRFHSCWCFSMRLTMVHFHFKFYILLIANVKMLSIMWI